MVFLPGIVEGKVRRHYRRIELYQPGGRLTGDGLCAIRETAVHQRFENGIVCRLPFHLRRVRFEGEERRIFKFDPVDAGTFMHEIINSFGCVKAKLENLDME